MCSFQGAMFHNYMKAITASINGLWHPPAFPCRLQHSIIGRTGLNNRVRDGYVCFPRPHRHQKFFIIKFCLNN